MECKVCKKIIADGSSFCNFCGSKQEMILSALTMDQMLEQIQNEISVTGYSFSEAGLINCKKWIKEFGFEIVFESVETALSQYLIEDKNGNYTQDSINEVFSKIGGIAKNKHTAITKPYISDAKRIINYAKKVFFINYYESNDLNADLNNLLYFFFTTKQYDGKVDDILAFVRGSKDKYEFLDKIDQLKDKFEIE